jgi:hypothetical protein
MILQGTAKGSRQRRKQPKIPEAKTEAASETLKAVRQQVAQIQDEVSRQALLSDRAKSKQI